MKPFWQLTAKTVVLPALRRRPIAHGVGLPGGHTNRAFSSDDYPTPTPKDDVIPRAFSSSIRSTWDERMHGRVEQERPAVMHKHFSTENYAPYVCELLKGLWSLDQNPMWQLVDELVGVGEPQNTRHICPEFPQWKHVVRAPNFTTAISMLISQRNIHQPEYGEDGDEEVLDDRHTGAVPTWLVMYLLATKVDSRAEAHQSLAFCLSQLDNTPAYFRASLLLISMCSLSAHGLVTQVPVLLASFRDIISGEGPFSVYSNRVSNHHQPGAEVPGSLVSQTAAIYQYNVLLTLLSRFPHVPGLAARVNSLLHHVHMYKIPIEAATASQLVAARFATSLLVRTLGAILESQEIAQNPPEQSSSLSIAMARFFSRQRGPHEGLEKYHGTSRALNPLKHAQTYILSLHDAAALPHIQKVDEEQKHQLERGHVLNPKHRRSRHSASCPGSRATTPLMRAIFTSMLWTTSLNRSVSATTFRGLYDAIRATHDTDNVLQTVALSGLLKRKAWSEAKGFWSQWQTENESVRRELQMMQDYFSRRNRMYGDAKVIRKAIGWTPRRQALLREMVVKMKVDATALSVAVRALAGPDTAALQAAFIMMDGFAIKIRRTTTQPAASSGDTFLQPLPRVSQLPRAVFPPNEFRPETVRLTSRVINCFMTRALHLGRPDVVFRLWDEMTSYYGVDTSIASLDIILRAARIATTMEASLGSVVPPWFRKGQSRDLLKGHVTFPDLGEEIRWMLGPDCRPGLRWDGAPPWRVVRHVFRNEFLFANWPWLRDIEIPANAVRGDEATSRIEALRELAMGNGLWGTQVHKMGKYPHLFPGMRTFREYVILLGRVQRSSEIPQVLAWMRALEVLPSKRMLSISLGLWSEVGLGSPVDDIWVSGNSGDQRDPYTVGGGARHGGEYGKLIAWLENWLGPDNVPSDAEVLDSLRYIRALEEAEAIS